MQHKFRPHSGLVSLFLGQLLALGAAATVHAQQLPAIPAQIQKSILSEPGVPLLGSSHADVTVIEYFDYNCPYCKALAPVFTPSSRRIMFRAFYSKSGPSLAGYLFMRRSRLWLPNIRASIFRLTMR